MNLAIRSEKYVYLGVLCISIYFCFCKKKGSEKGGGDQWEFEIKYRLEFTLSA